MSFTKKHIKSLIATGEGLHIDFKRSMNSGHAKTLVSFANSKGGKLLLGVEDDGTISGHKLSNSEKSKIGDIARDCDPPIDITLYSVSMGRGLSVTVVEVPISKNPPHRCTSGYYVRVGASSTKLTTRQLTDFLVLHGILGFDEYVVSDSNWSKILSKVNLRRFKSLLSEGARQVDDTSLISNLDLVKDQYPTNAGILLLAKNASNIVFQFTVRCVAYAGNDTGSKILDQKILAITLLM